MAYEGKFVDRTPSLRPAGVVHFKYGENVAGCLVQDVSEDELRPFVCERGPIDFDLPPRQTQIYNGWYTDVRECLQPEVNKSFFDVLTDEFKATVYDTYWKKEVGRVPDSSPMFPAGMDPKALTYGKPTPPLTKAGDLINPPKCYSDVMAEARVGHDMYKMTHQDFDPGEPISRNYIEPFKQGLVWGKITPSDPQGGCLRMVMDVEKGDKLLVSKVLADYKKRTKPLVGQVFAPNNNVDCVPKGHAFGKLNKRELYGAGDLLKESPPSLDKLDLYEEISYINLIRNSIAKKQPTFPHRDFKKCLNFLDKKQSGFLHIDDAYKLLAEFGISTDRQLFEALLMRLGILSKDRIVDYEKMADILNVNVLFPDIGKLDDVPKEILQFETTNQLSHRYHNDPNYSPENIPPAGIPSGQRISMRAIVSPNIFTNYFLEPKDFFVSRTPVYIRTLFGRVGCELDDTTFEMLWKAAQDNEGCVSVQSFLDVLKSCK